MHHVDISRVLLCYNGGMIYAGLLLLGTLVHQVASHALLRIALHAAFADFDGGIIDPAGVIAYKLFAILSFPGRHIANQSGVEGDWSYVLGSVLWAAMVVMILALSRRKHRAA